MGPHVKELGSFASMEMDSLELFLLCLRTTWAVRKSLVAAPDESKFLSEEEKAWLSHIYTTTQALLRGRTLSYLKEGNYGIVPDFTESGDLVCLLMGCSALVMLRK